MLTSNERHLTNLTGIEQAKCTRIRTKQLWEGFKYTHICVYKDYHFMSNRDCSFRNALKSVEDYQSGTADTYLEGLGMSF